MLACPHIALCKSTYDFKARLMFQPGASVCDIDPRRSKCCDCELISTRSDTKTLQRHSLHTSIACHRQRRRSFFSYRNHRI